jgi:hypothetical protein
VKTLRGLPRLAAEHLAAHVQLHSRRYFLQNGIPLVTDATPIAPADSGLALAAAAPVPLVEAIARGLEAAKLECRTIVPLSLISPGASNDPFAAARAVAQSPVVPLALLPDVTRSERRARERRSFLTWGVVAASSVALAIGAWFAVQIRSERVAERELAHIRPAVESAIAVRSDLDATDDALAVLSRAAVGRAHRVRLLAELTRALPDSGFLVSVRLEPDGRGSLAGYAPSAAQVLARLERTGTIAHGVMDGPVTREVVAGKERERFAIRFDVPAQPRSR